METLKYIKFSNQELPTCPFIWSYNDCMFPVNFAEKVDKNSFILPNNIRDMIKKYTCEYYQVEQTLFETENGYQDVMSVSFHSWIFSKMNPSQNNMTNYKCNTYIVSGLFTESNILQGGKYGIEINSVGKRRVHVHNNRLSPKYENTFWLRNILKIKPQIKEINFVTIGIFEPLKICCITQHILVIE
jgi:hypothetical protein